MRNAKCEMRNAKCEMRIQLLCVPEFPVQSGRRLRVDEQGFIGAQFPVAMVEFDVGVSPSSLGVHAVEPSQLVVRDISELVCALLKLGCLTKVQVCEEECEQQR